MPRDLHCNLTGCGARVAPKRLFCISHWYRISKPTQDRVLSAYQSAIRDPEGRILRFDSNADRDSYVTTMKQARAEASRFPSRDEVSHG